MIRLHTAGTPNGRKISIALEELELPYEVHAVNLAEEEQLRPAFLALNPNHKIPVIEDDGLVIWAFMPGGDRSPASMDGHAHFSSKIREWADQGGFCPE